MNLTEFTSIVRNKYPNAVIHKHKTELNNRVELMIMFYRYGKAFTYKGTYCEILNKLGIKAITKYEFDTLCAKFAVLECAIKNEDGVINKNNPEYLNLYEKLYNIKNGYIII